MILPSPGSTLLFSLFINLSTLSFCSLAQKVIPAKRHYDSHVYYVLELNPSQLLSNPTPQDIATALGAEHVEQVGELKHHYLIRAHKDVVKRGEPILDAEQHLIKRSDAVRSLQSRDRVMERFELLKRGETTTNDALGGLIRRARGASSSADDDAQLQRRFLLSSIRSLERQHLRQRIKRQFIEPPPLSTTRRLSRRSPAPPPIVEEQEDTSLVPTALELLQLMFQIQDPVFPKQWHLINQVIEENTINVTGVWAEEIYGKGVNVAIVDDGLDMNSDDLKDNFVRHPALLAVHFDED
jgi:kexin